MKINVRLYILFFLTAVTVEEISSKGIECHKGVKFYDRISLSWHHCSICSEPEGSQFEWQCNQCCPETTTSRPPTTASPSTESSTHILDRLPKLSNESSVSNTSLKSHHLPLRSSTAGKPWTKADTVITVITVLGVTLAITVVIAIAFVTWKILTKRSRNIYTVQVRVVADKNDGNPEEQLSKPIECTDQKTNKSPVSPLMTRADMR